jgi:hypothetical protein
MSERYFYEGEKDDEHLDLSAEPIDVSRGLKTSASSIPRNRTVIIPVGGVDTEFSNPEVRNQIQRWERINRGHPNGSYSDQNIVSHAFKRNRTEVYAAQLELNPVQSEMLKTVLLPHDWRGFELDLVILAVAALIVYADKNAKRSERETHPNTGEFDKLFTSMLAAASGKNGRSFRMKDFRSMYGKLEKDSRYLRVRESWGRGI